MGSTLASREAFLDVLKTHLVPTEIVEWQETLSELPPDALARFIEARLDLVIEALLKKLDGIETKVYDSAPPALAGALDTAAELQLAPEADDAESAEA